MVFDGDRDTPVPDAVVKVTSFHSGTSAGPVNPTWSATTDANGLFGFTASLPPDWRELRLEASRSRYEPGPTYIEPAVATDAAVLKSQPLLSSFNVFYLILHDFQDRDE